MPPGRQLARPRLDGKWGSITHAQPYAFLTRALLQKDPNFAHFLTLQQFTPKKQGNLIDSWMNLGRRKFVTLIWGFGAASLTLVVDYLLLMLRV